MALSQRELNIIKWGKENEKSLDEIKEAILNSRQGLIGKPKRELTQAPQITQEIPVTQPIQTGQEPIGKRGVLGLAKAGRFIGEKIGQAFGAIPKPEPIVIPENIKFKLSQTTVGKSALEAIETTHRMASKVKEAFSKLDPETQTLLKSLPEIANLIPPLGVSKIAVEKGVRKTGELLGEGIEAVTKKAVEFAETPTGVGITQTVKDFAERIPRLANRGKEAVQEATIRAERIKVSTPEVQVAIQSGLDDRIINTITLADKPTVLAYKEMLDIAESSTAKAGGVLKVKQRPEIVAGKVAEEQYKLIDKKRKSVGAEIGTLVDKLSKTAQVSMQKSYQTLDRILEKQGIAILPTEKGLKLDFSGTSFTPAERNRIEELYKLAREGGDKLSPKLIRDKDQLFSKLQRETRLEGIGEILIDTEEGKSSLFKIFRDVFSKELDNISPEIRGLNKEYRKYITLQDDIENSIIKSGKFETTKGVSGAEFAQTNLRRLSSDALSAADYRAIVAEMDKVARELGYVGANAEELALFATELRKLYPEIVPSTSFTGGIRTGVMDVAERFLKAGVPDVTDQQKALKAMLEALIKSE